MVIYLKIPSIWNIVASGINHKGMSLAAELDHLVISGLGAISKQISRKLNTELTTALRHTPTPLSIELAGSTV